MKRKPLPSSSSAQYKRPTTRGWIIVIVYQNKHLKIRVQFMGDVWLWEANSNGIWAIIGIFVARRTYLGPKLLNKLSRELRTLTSLSSFENCIPKCDLSLLVNKETRTSLPSPAVVLEVPQWNLRTSMCDCTVWPDSERSKSSLLFFRQILKACLFDSALVKS